MRLHSLPFVVLHDIMEKDADGFYIAPAVECPHLIYTRRKNRTWIPAAATTSKETTDLIKSTFDVHVTLTQQQEDKSSPLYSVKSFEELGLHADLLKKERSTSAPERSSQSGTGKTAAFVLTMLSRVDFTINKPQALCLAPSRELARKIMSVIAAIGTFTPVQTENAIKDHLPRGVSNITAHIVVGTPGTMTDLIRRRGFVLDEADNMLDKDGLGDQTLRVKNMLPRSGQTQIILFSATFSDLVRNFASKFAPNANEIELQRNELAVDSIRQFYMDCKSEEHKYGVLVSLYHLLTIGQSIIFCHQRRTADRITQRMVAEGHKVASLHGAREGPGKGPNYDQRSRAESTCCKSAWR
ncbi:P-loop containing nucleoside triphosphate hydrolase protein [Russula emetica]|nr:P-loop containing nucleoside triphosphate hydrolase protein [Russula emetica]